MHTDAARHIPRLRRAVLGVALAGTMALAVVGPDDSDVPRVLAAQRAYLGDAYVPPGGSRVPPAPEGTPLSIELFENSLDRTKHGAHAVLFHDGLLLVHGDWGDGGVLECIAQVDAATTERLITLATALVDAERPNYCMQTIHCWSGDVVLRVAHTSGVTVFREQPWHMGAPFRELETAFKELMALAEFRSFGVLAEACVDSTGFGTRRPPHGAAPGFVR